jgi:hypothetical protein
MKMDTFIGGLALLIFVAGLVPLFIFGQSMSHKLFSYFYSKYGPLRVQEIILTADLESAGFPTGPTSTFSPTHQRIYCFIRYQVSKIVDFHRTDLLVKWYYQGQVIHHSHHSLPNDYPILAYRKAPKQTTFRPGHFVSYIEAPLNDRFDRGCYTVKLFIEHSPKILVKTVEFEVE